MISYFRDQSLYNLEDEIVTFIDFVTRIMLFDKYRTPDAVNVLDIQHFSDMMCYYKYMYTHFAILNWESSSFEGEDNLPNNPDICTTWDIRDIHDVVMETRVHSTYDKVNVKEFLEGDDTKRDAACKVLNAIIFALRKVKRDEIYLKDGQLPNVRVLMYSDDTTKRRKLLM